MPPRRAGPAAARRSRTSGASAAAAAAAWWLLRGASAPARGLPAFVGTGLPAFVGTAAPPRGGPRPRPGGGGARGARARRRAAAESRCQVLVVGAGVAGLVAAGKAVRAGLSCTVVEASDGVGGQARTDHYNGYVLDRGFCVFSAAPPQVSECMDVEALELQPLMPAVRMQRGGDRPVIADPRRVSPQVIWEVLTNPLCTVADKVTLTLYVLRLIFVPDILLGKGLNEDDEASIEDKLLKELNLSPSIVDAMFRPILQGAFKIPLSMLPGKYLDNFFQNFWQTGDSYPRRGIGSVAEQLHERLPKGCVRLGCTVKEVSGGETGGQAVLESGERISFDAAVIATEAWNAARLMGEEPDERQGGVGVTLYFGMDESDVPFRETCKLLNGEGTATDGRTVNSLAFPSSVVPGRAPPGKALCGVLIVGAPALPEEELVEDVRGQLSAWFGPSVRSWQYLRWYVTRQTLPPKRSPVPSRAGGRLYRCGDHTEIPCIYGAMSSGLRSGEAVCEDLLG